MFVLNISNVKYNFCFHTWNVCSKPWNRHPQPGNAYPQVGNKLSEANFRFLEHTAKFPEYFGKFQSSTAPALSAGDLWNEGKVEKCIKLCYGPKSRYLLKLSLIRLKAVL